MSQENFEPADLERENGLRAKLDMRGQLSLSIQRWRSVLTSA